MYALPLLNQSRIFYSINKQAAINSTAVAEAYNVAVRFWPSLAHDRVKVLQI
ncbi:hypothetical protein MTYM_01269 [Methylococcales bacterium]|nr:hypothetical protein MTYM_01269 [Methylococcales bacterium]